MWVICEEVPCGAGFVDDVFVAVEDGDREFIGDARRHAKTATIRTSTVPRHRFRHAAITIADIELSADSAVWLIKVEPHF